MMKKFFTTLCMAILLAAMVVIPSVHAEERPLEDLPICKIDGFMVAMPETLEGLEDGSSCIVKAIPLPRIRKTSRQVMKPMDLPVPRSRLPNPLKAT